MFEIKVCKETEEEAIEFLRAQSLVAELAYKIEEALILIRNKVKHFDLSDETVGVLLEVSELLRGKD